MNRESDSSSRKDLYAYDGSGQNGQRSHDGAGELHEQTESSKDSRTQNWHPDYSLSSPSAREWHEQNKQSRHQPLKLNEEDGTYTVQHGDCLSTIAARELDAEGKAVNKKSIAHEVQEIIDLNRNEHSELVGNKDYLGAGWRLRLPGGAATTQDTYEQPTQPRRQIASSAEQAPPGPMVNSAAPGADYQVYESGPRSAQQGVDRQRQETVRLAQDLLQGNVRDAALVLHDVIGHGDSSSCIQQANQLADQAARQQGAKSPAHITVRQDGDVAIVDQNGREVVQAGNIYRQNDDGSGRQGFRPIQSEYEPITYAPSSTNVTSGYYSEPASYPRQQANSHSWRANYGVSGGLAQQLQSRDEQIHSDMQSVKPEGRWQPNAGNIRNWNDQFDDPAMNQGLADLRQKNGLSKVFGDPGSGASKVYDVSRIFS